MRAPADGRDRQPLVGDAGGRGLALARGCCEGCTGASRGIEGHRTFGSRRFASGGAGDRSNIARAGCAVFSGLVDRLVRTPHLPAWDAVDPREKARFLRDCGFRSIAEFTGSLASDAFAGRPTGIYIDTHPMNRAPGSDRGMRIKDILENNRIYRNTARVAYGRQLEKNIEITACYRSPG